MKKGDKDTLQYIVKNIKDRKWRKRGKWHQSVVLSEIIEEGETTANSKKMGYPFKKSRGIWLSTGDFLDLQKEWDDLKKIVVKEYEKDRKYLKKYALDCTKEAESLIKFSSEISPSKTDNLNDKELVDIYSKLISKCKDIMPFMFSLNIFNEFLTDKFEFLLTEFFNKNNLDKNKYFDYKTILTYPYKKIFVLEEIVELFKIAVFIKDNKIDINNKIVDKKLEGHAKKFGWINIGHIENLPYDKNYFKSKVKQLIKTDVAKEYNSILKEDQKFKKDQKKLMKEIESNKELHEISEAVQIFGFLKSFRMDALIIALFNCWNVTEEIAKRLNIDVMDFKYLSSHEIKESFFNSLKYKQLIKDRQKKNCSIIINNERYEISGNNCDTILKHIKQEEQKVKNMFKGSIAFPGKIKGVCKVLYKTEDMSKIEKGDILVISMTDPDYIQAMEKAVAFITDQGGILCHAAIIAREMKKPCVIGTKIATQVLKDGDLVEVDADQGIIKILKK